MVCIKSWLALVGYLSLDFFFMNLCSSFLFEILTKILSFSDGVRILTSQNKKQTINT